MNDFKYDSKRDEIFYDGDVWERVKWTEFVPRGMGDGVCAECNSSMFDGDQFCPNCGRKVVSE